MIHCHNFPRYVVNEESCFLLDSELTFRGQAYRSAQFDENRVTITVRRDQRDETKRVLSERGATTLDLKLAGRFHWSDHKAAADEVISIVGKELLSSGTPADTLILPSSLATSPADDESQYSSVVRSVLLEAPDWFKTVRRLHEGAAVQDGIIVSFGHEKVIPPSLIRQFRSQLVNMSDLEKSYRLDAETDIAVVGMACKVAGADDLDEFWQMLCRGESQHRKVPSDRFGFDSPFRQAANDKSWFGNFVNDHDSFDHKFFKKTPREVASMDPQQRQFLQTAYQAVEQSGYFQSAATDTRVGCYVGMSAVDYENNVACHAPNAYSATGTLRGFVAGKVSHFFGWTGPGLTLDTACSSSAVAVHLACQAILNGECTAALAGGVNLITSPLFYQNLGAASFLSKTGQCKPFDAAADGYCRGEGCGAVFLKKLSSAIADGDTIHGVIAGTAVQQNENCTPIVVPNVPSLSDLFTKVVAKAHLRPEQIGVVEAHGTGTPVGDPAEYDSVRKVLGGNACKRDSQLMLGSVKGLVGHLEATSGVVSLIKSLLMIKHAMIPPQASFTTINPAIKASVADLITIPRGVTPWNSDLRAVLINNYGASGSNASMVVIGHTGHKKGRPAVSHKQLSAKLPFRLGGLDDMSIAAYAAKLLATLEKRPATTLAALAHSINHQSNPTLPRQHIFAGQTVSDVARQLGDLASGKLTELSHSHTSRDVPVILCFGGQVSKSVGLDRGLFDSALTLRTELERCDHIAQSLGAESIFPHIFQGEAIDDIVVLQTCLFSLQLATAQAWIQCGVRPAGVMGHSFGELTAMAVAGVLGTEDALKMVIARARIIREQWTTERGAMMAIEASVDDARLLVQTTNAALAGTGSAPLVIACYNGPRSFTLAGSTASVEHAIELNTSNMALANIKMKRLNVTHAFHSTLTEPLVQALDEAASSLTFRKPKIDWMRCTETEDMPEINASFFGNHLRQPVYFDHCVRRMAAKYPQGVWLEAGSNSTVTNMASRALGKPQDSIFVAANLSGEAAASQLTESTLALWKAGIDAVYWSHHRSQHDQYESLILPPYQFAKLKHWLDLKTVPIVEVISANTISEEAPPTTWLTFLGFQDGQAQRHARFRINATVPRFQTLMGGHKTAQTAPICPATVQMDLAIDALSQIVPTGTDFNPEILNISNTAPICDNPAAQLWLDFKAMDANANQWQFTISSTEGSLSRSPTIHTTGVLVPSAKSLTTETDLSRYQRVVTHKRCLDILNCSQPDEVMQGRVIYKAFAEVVDYDEQYHGVAKLVGKDESSAGRVDKTPNPASWFDAHLSDAFCQVGGIFLNCMTDRSPADIFICRGLERWMRSAKLQQLRPSKYDVLALHNGSVAAGSFLTDVFVFDPSTGALVEAILGLNFVKVQKQAIAKTLLRLTVPPRAASQPASVEVQGARPSYRLPVAAARQQPRRSETAPDRIPSTRAPQVTTKRTGPSRAQSNDLFPALRAIVAALVGVGEQDIHPHCALADLGVDSLMAMELVSELEGKFRCTFSLDDASQVQTINELVDFVRSSTTIDSDHDLGLDSSDSDSDHHHDESLASSRTSLTITPAETDVASQRVDIVSMLSALVGVDAADLLPGAVLCELGVDSLMSMEVRAALESECEVQIDEDVAIETLTVAELSQLVNGPSTSGTSNIAVELAKSLSVPATHKDESLSPAVSNLDFATVSAVFAAVKAKTDQRIEEAGCVSYFDSVLPLQDELCAALTLEAFEELGCSLRHAEAAQRIQLPVYPASLQHLVRHLCHVIEKNSGIFICEGDNHVIRSTRPYKIRQSSTIMTELQSIAPQEDTANDLVHYVGSHLPDLLRGKTDGIKLIFGCERGRTMVADFYAQWPLHRLCYHQLESFLDNLVQAISSQPIGKLKIMEMGAGTGGTTRWLLPLLARSGRAVEYTFTDVSPSLVIQARKRYQTQYPFMRFQTHDIEKDPAPELVGSQHIVISSNAVHATHDLVLSTGNIRKVLQRNGVLLMVEMTQPPFWMDLVFGVFKGWWLFEDGRSHALADEHRWRQALEAAGFGFTDWTSGLRPESEVERVVMAVNGGFPSQKQEVSPVQPLVPVQRSRSDSRHAAVDKYIDQMCSDLPDLSSLPHRSTSSGITRACVLVTGGTGSLGSHLVADLAGRDDVAQVVVLNRKGSTDPLPRQLEAFTSRHLSPRGSALQKMRVIATDASKPMFGLERAEYYRLANSVTHIVHSAWAMSIKRPIHGFGAQFDIMHNLIRLAFDTASAQDGSHKIHFQFVSSIAVVGHYPLQPGRDGPHVPEARVDLADVLPHGYGDAKFACERALDRTLHRRPDLFATSCVRIGQIAGASTGPGCWNPHEHIPLLLKSSQTLGCLPQFQGPLSWTPVDIVAGTLADILLSIDEPFPIYHIDNPVRQQWSHVLPVLAQCLRRQSDEPLSIVPLKRWLDLVRAAGPTGPDGANPASMLADFIEHDFERMSCGGLLLGTAHSIQHSETLAATGPVSDERLRRYIGFWKDCGFLSI